MNSQQDALERDVMSMLLAGSDPTLETLAAQFRLAQTAKRENTGTGFFTEFLLPPDAPKVAGEKSFSFGDVDAEIDGLQFGAGFVLHVRNGTINCLEGYSYEEPWPAGIKS